MMTSGLVMALAGMIAAAPTVTVGKVVGEVELLRAGQETQPVPLAGGEELAELDRIYTGVESSAELTFADGSKVVVQELSDMKVALFRMNEKTVETSLWLKAGEIAADVHRTPAVRSDFSIRTPTATCSVRGTQVQSIRTYWGGTQVRMGGHGLMQMSSHKSGASTFAGANQQMQAQGDGNVDGQQGIASQQSRASSQANGISRNEARINQTGNFLTAPPSVTQGDIGSPTGGVLALRGTAEAGTSMLPAILRAINDTPRLFDDSSGVLFYDIGPGALNGRPNVVQDVNIAIRFQKHDGETFADPATGTPFHNEIGFSLTNPAGVKVDLIRPESFNTGTDAFRGVIVFDQSAPQVVNFDRNMPHPGTFRPAGDLNAFNGGPVAGRWRLFVEDTVVADALSYQGSVLEIRH